MVELTLAYWNKLASQIVFISALLGGFSLAVIASLLNAKEINRVSLNLIRASTIAAASFLVTIFSMSKILMMTTEGFPIAVQEGDFALPRFIGFCTFITGIIALIVIISLAGWTKSRQTGVFTTVVGIIAFILMGSMLM